MVDFPNSWMWSEACDMLARAERLHREFFRPGPSGRIPSWQPPVDVIETEREVLVLVALPGVDPERVEAAIDGPDHRSMGLTSSSQEVACCPPSCGRL